MDEHVTPSMIVLIIIMILVAVAVIWSANQPEPQEVKDKRLLVDAINNITRTTNDCIVLKAKKLEIFNLGGRANEWMSLSEFYKMADYVKEKMEILEC